MQVLEVSGKVSQILAWGGRNGMVGAKFLSGTEGNFRISFYTKSGKVGMLGQREREESGEYHYKETLFCGKRVVRGLEKAGIIVDLSGLKASSALNAA